MNCTVAANSGLAGSGGVGGSGAPPGSNGSNGNAWGGLRFFGGTLINTLLATNSPGGNGQGWLNDLGYNLSSDATCAFTNVGSLNNTDPKLGPLTNNGGPTLTMALLASSPAIDAADSSAAPAMDQRGVPRSLGRSADIGAFEYNLPAALHLTRSGPAAVDVIVYGVVSQSCRLLASSNFIDWTSIATNQIGTNGTVMFQDSWNPSLNSRFYRAVMP